MRRPTNLNAARRPSLPLMFLTLFLIVLWVAGGASRSDVLGQVIVRASAFGILAAIVLFGVRPNWSSGRPVFYFLLAIYVSALIHVIPLPPLLWEQLPGRLVFVEASAMIGEPPPWRAISIVPGQAMNALFSLIVPTVVLFLIFALPETERSRPMTILLFLMSASTIIALLQFSGVGFDNPFLNDVTWYASGVFANRNHYALWLSIGCVFAAAWAFHDHQPRPWRAFVALGLILLFVLTILATGSRAGMLLGVLGALLGLALTWTNLKKLLGRNSRFLFSAILMIVGALVAAVVALSISTGRAVSVQRVMELDVAQDLRVRALPTTLAMIKDYFPFGSGFGSFEPMFRMREPAELLRPGYFNHAHNDYVEIVSDGGLLGALLLIAAILWWAVASIHAWKVGPRASLARAGSATLFLIFTASIFDYPARVPSMMAVIVIAAFWLTTCPTKRPRAALPADDQHL